MPTKPQTDNVKEIKIKF